MILRNEMAMSKPNDNRVGEYNDSSTGCDGLLCD